MKQGLLQIFFWLWGLSVGAQTITGTVLGKGEAPLSGVNISLVSSKQHTHSNESGMFTLASVSLGDSILFSHLGYESKYLVIEELTGPITIKLHVKQMTLNEVVVSQGIDAMNVVTNIDIQTNPVNSSQEVLRLVPGLFIAQHAGGGKAEQIFLRGFDIDHGTDIKITVDDIPVNMVSHAHGQGYSDLHYLIPETIEKIDFAKGSYDASQGNFATAGHVSFRTKDQLERSSVSMETGLFNTNRVVGMINLIDSEKDNAYVATEFLATDGPFDSPQNFHRINLFGKYMHLNNSGAKLGLTLSHFDSRWDASGQIPIRAVQQGIIGRFGAIDDTEGGRTSRTNAIVHHEKRLNERALVKTSAYISHYDFELYSNFTFFLEDSVNGDQIRQRENRMLYGFKSAYIQDFSLGKWNANWRSGVEWRYDQVNNNELAHTRNRKVILDSVQFGDVNEWNAGAFSDFSLSHGRWRLNPGLRVDYFDFQYQDRKLTNYAVESLSKPIVSPKFNLFFDAAPNAQLYIKSGKGFHSNDTRVIVRKTSRSILPATYGFDAGAMWKPSSKWLLNVAYWYLLSEQEFVYVGDAGIIELSGESQRQGVDAGIRYQPFYWLTWNADVNYAHARAIEEPEGENYIPLAPDLTAVSSIKIKFETGFFGSVQWRFINDRPANEDNSIIAKGYSVLDLNAGYTFKRWILNLQVQNLLNTEWDETQFATESRLAQESVPVEEIHFTPGIPFFLRGNLTFKF